MEALLFMFNSLAVVVMVFMGLRDDRRGPGVPHTSIFRTRDTAEAAAKPAAETASAPVHAEPWAPWERAGGGSAP